MTNYLLCLYCDIKYYLKKQVMIDQKPINIKKLFNFFYFSF